MKKQISFKASVFSIIIIAFISLFVLYLLHNKDEETEKICSGQPLVTADIVSIAVYSETDDLHNPDRKFSGFLIELDKNIVVGNYETSQVRYSIDMRRGFGSLFIIASHPEKKYALYHIMACTDDNGKSFHLDPSFHALSR